MVELGIILIVMLLIIIGLGWWIDWLTPIFEEDDNDNDK